MGKRKNPNVGSEIRQKKKEKKSNANNSGKWLGKYCTVHFLIFLLEK